MTGSGFRRPRIMGIVNVTHDSFFSSSRAVDVGEVRSRAVSMAREGADIIDIGGESSRPGSEYVSLEEECRRVVPAVTAVREALPEIEISVDTRKARVAEAALDAGATMINDISGLRDDPDLPRLIAERSVPVCIMHMRGTPPTMQVAPRYDDVIAEIRRELLSFVRIALDAGVRREQIIIDPGIGFGKRFEHNWTVLRCVSELVDLGYPVLIGLSRKSFLGEVRGEVPPRPPEERLYATLAAQLWCTLQGVSVLRVHDVRPMVEMSAALEAIITAP